jgi:pimeloyl-ACP methyl ester carboxylesterase
VLENREQPSGWARLHVAIFRSPNPNPAPDPVIYLTGGPGADTFEALDYYLQIFGDAILAKRDLIFFNQRGLPHGEPQLACPGYAELLHELAAPGPGKRYIDRTQREARQIEFLATCYQELTARGIPLEMYNSAASAADADDLRAALGYAQVNYFGTSYGALLGSLILRDHPAGVRSVVLDSVLPPDALVFEERGFNAYEALRRLFDGCAADPQCDEQHPYLQEKLLAVVDQLNFSPRTAPWGDEQEIMYNGGDLLDVIYAQLYYGDPGAAIDVIEQTSAGDFSTLDSLALARIMFNQAGVQIGFHYNIACREGAALSSYEGYYERVDGLPTQIVEHYKPSLYLGLCQRWGVEPADPVERELAVSDAPVLLFSGALDPASPPRWTRRTAYNLSNSFFYVFPSFGHGVVGANECALGMMLQFLDDPTNAPDSSCMD